MIYIWLWYWKGPENPKRCMLESHLPLEPGLDKGRVENTQGCKGSPVFQTAYMPIKGKLFCFWCNFFFVFRFFLYVGLVKQLGDLKRKKTFLSLAKKRKCGFHPFFFEDLFNSLYEDTHFFSLRLSYLFNTPVVGWELSVKHKFCTYKESLRNFRDLLFRG